MNIEQFDFGKYKTHPRVVELRFIMIYDTFVKTIGVEDTNRLFSGICSGFRINVDVINGVLNRRFDIKRYLKTNKVRYRQDIIFMGKCFGESSYRIARKYLNTSPSNLYVNEYRLSEFLNEEWLLRLADSVCHCGTEYYRNEIIRFIEAIEKLDRVLIDLGGEE